MCSIYVMLHLIAYQQGMVKIKIFRLFELVRREGVPSIWFIHRKCPILQLWGLHQEHANARSCLLEKGMEEIWNGWVFSYLHPSWLTSHWIWRKKINGLFGLSSPCTSKKKAPSPIFLDDYVWYWIWLCVSMWRRESGWTSRISQDQRRYNASLYLKRKVRAFLYISVRSVKPAWRV